MGQSDTPRRNAVRAAPVRRTARTKLPPPEPATLAIFPTELGWVGAVGRADVLLFLTIGHATPDQVRTEAARNLRKWKLGTIGAERRWCGDLIHRLQDYSKGKRVVFHDIVLQLPELTEFQQRILTCTRAIGFGKTMTYGELAARAGFPNAARGVGTVMSRNRFPLIIPCHRVVAAQGKLGGFTSPQGVRLKEKLLAMEAAHLRRLVLTRQPPRNSV